MSNNINYFFPQFVLLKSEPLSLLLALTGLIWLPPQISLSGREEVVWPTPSQPAKPLPLSLSKKS